MFQLGFHSAILPDRSFADVFQIAKQIGYDCVEVMCWPPSQAERRYAGVTHVDITNSDERFIDSVKSVVAQTGVKISAMSYYPNPLSPDATEAQLAVEHLSQLIKIVKKFDVHTVNTFIGRDYTLSVDDNWPRLLETWRPIVNLAEDCGVSIGIENCPMLFGPDEWPGGKNIATSPRIWSRLFNDIDSPNLGLNYDPSHMVWQQMCYLQPIRDFADKFVHLHAKDVRIDRASLNELGILAHPNDYHTPKLPGMGEIDWGKFFSELTDSVFRGPVCVEVEDRAFEKTDPNRMLSLQQSYTFLRNYAPASIAEPR